MTDQPPRSLFSSTSAWGDEPIPLPPAPDLQIGRITFAHTEKLRKIAELLELARDATDETDMNAFLDEAIDLARRHD